jgi:hypothetical protein|tara:strand:+ start:1481 stop:1717 length:237 start_codon:yes stop_codon:yes gene_type:complete
MKTKEIIMWAALGLLTISNISLHMDSEKCEKRTHGIAQRMGRSDVQSRWAEMKKEGPKRIRPERVLPEGRRGKPNKVK